MKIAIIGSGISGNVVAYKLHKEHDITVFESADYIGGHVNTIDFELENQLYSVDTGFIVFNDRTYSNFISLLEELNVEDQSTNMSFSVSCNKSGLEYSGTNLNTIFSQRRNLLSLTYHRMLLDIIKFNKNSVKYINQNHSDISLGEYLNKNNYSEFFIDKYLVPMSSAIWSSKPRNIFSMPLKFLVNFFDNHGLLSLANRPTWKVIKGGSKEYLKKLILGYQEKIRVNQSIESITRHSDKVEISHNDGKSQRFDCVFLACHSDQALRILSDPSKNEEAILGAIKYQTNEAILHTDESFLPKNKRAWAAWNYNIPKQDQELVTLTYNMNILQGINSKYTFCVTLNNSSQIKKDKIIRKIEYQHPIFTKSAIEAQASHSLISNNRTFYCGAYWYNGFHEDGVVSALEAIKHFEGSALSE